MARKRRKPVSDFVLDRFVGPPQHKRGRRCHVAEACRSYLDSLNLSPDFFDPIYDRCYCPDCSEYAGLPEVMTSAGEVYELPLGFSGFGIKVPPRASSLRIFEEWHVSYHGLRAAVLSSVLHEGGLLMPGDALLDGTTLEAIHTRGGPQRHQLYTSPSVLYSAHEIYTKPVRFNDRNAKVVLQCRQRPGYAIGGDTIGWERQNPGMRISKHVPNSGIERYTQSRGSIIVYRVLVKLDPLLYTVRWSSGLGSVTSDQIEKCHARDFIIVGDVVKAAFDLDYASTCCIADDAGTVVKKGSLGTIASPTETGWVVSWSGRNLGSSGATSVNKDQITKCDASDFVTIGDVVKAALDLDYASTGCIADDAGTVVKKGSLGTIASPTETGWVVSWSGRSLGVTSVNKDQLSKCARHEFWSAGDIVRAAYDLEYPSIGTVSRGSLGSLEALP